MTNNNFSQVAAFIWSVADLLRGDFKQSQYGRVILPFTLLRRLECVLAPTKAEVLANEKSNKCLYQKKPKKNASQGNRWTVIFNTSELDLGSLGQKDIRANLNNYIQNFSKDAEKSLNTSNLMNSLVYWMMPTYFIKLCKSLLQPT